MVYVYSPKKEEKLRDELPDVVRKGMQFYLEKGENLGVNYLPKDMTKDQFLDYCRIKSLGEDVGKDRSFMQFLIELPIIYTSEGSVDNLADSFAGGFS